MRSGPSDEPNTLSSGMDIPPPPPWASLARRRRRRVRMGPCLRPWATPSLGHPSLGHPIHPVLGPRGLGHPTGLEPPHPGRQIGGRRAGLPSVCGGGGGHAHASCAHVASVHAAAGCGSSRPSLTAPCLGYKKIFVYLWFILYCLTYIPSVLFCAVLVYGSPAVVPMRAGSAVPKRNCVYDRETGSNSLSGGGGGGEFKT